MLIGANKPLVRIKSIRYLEVPDYEKRIARLQELMVGMLFDYLNGYSTRDSEHKKE